jgi:hypothetical protein
MFSNLNPCNTGGNGETVDTLSSFSSIDVSPFISFVFGCCYHLTKAEGNTFMGKRLFCDQPERPCPVAEIQDH